MNRSSSLFPLGLATGVAIKDATHRVVLRMAVTLE